MIVGGDVVARQTRNAAADEHEQDGAVQSALHPAAITDDGWRDTERDDVGEGIQFAAEQGCPLTPPGDTPVENVEDQRQQDQSARHVQMPDAAFLEVGHRRKKRADTTGRIAQGEPVGQGEVTNHGKRSRFRGHRLARAGGGASLQGTVVGKTWKADRASLGRPTLQLAGP
jgi:hypothetical protein